MAAPLDVQKPARPLIIVGCGGHALVLIDALMSAGETIIAAVDDDLAKSGTLVGNVRVIGTDQAIFQHDAREVLLVNGVGSIGRPDTRKRVFERLKHAGYGFATVIHPSAVIARDAALAEGVQIMAGAVIQPRCAIGVNTIVNTRAGIDHDANIGAHVHIAPGATICGDVTIGGDCHIGAGATVIQGVSLAAGCIVGAGAVVVKSVDRPAMLCGVPARARAG